jgi:small subunit ribosomal protein S15
LHASHAHWKAVFGRHKIDGGGAFTMTLSVLFRSTPLVTGKRLGACLTPSVTPVLSTVRVDMQIRSKMTKTKKRRIIKNRKKAADALRGVFPPKPVGYIDKNTPVINSIPREERLAISQAEEEAAAKELNDKLAVEKEPLRRFHFDGLQMSDRVRKLFNLSNGNQKEVVAAQKQRGMQLFQIREGDTGSSAVQIIALTTRIQQLQTHFRKHKKDKHGKRGMDALYVRRRKLLDYLERQDFEAYRKVSKTLGLVR